MVVIILIYITYELCLFFPWPLFENLDQKLCQLFCRVAAKRQSMVPLSFFFLSLFGMQLWLVEVAKFKSGKFEFGAQGKQKFRLFLPRPRNPMQSSRSCSSLWATSKQFMFKNDLFGDGSQLG
jgi:hypothetical protein